MRKTEYVKVKIYKPLFDKHMQGLDYDTVEQFEQMLLRNAGGFTKHSHCNGAWLDGAGDRINDPLEIYEMIVDNNPSVIANLRAQAKVIQEEMRQDCVLFTIEPLLEMELVC